MMTECALEEVPDVTVLVLLPSGSASCFAVISDSAHRRRCAKDPHTRSAAMEVLSGPSGRRAVGVDAGQHCTSEHTSFAPADHGCRQCGVDLTSRGRRDETAYCGNHPHQGRRPSPAGVRNHLDTVGGRILEHSRCVSM